MKAVFKILALAVIALHLSACSTSKEPKAVAIKEESNKVEEKSPGAGFISGTVTEIQQGKDGYTAQIISPSGEVFLATVSRANLTDPLTYRPVKVGEIINVKGDQWQMENQDHITVRVLK